MGTLDENCQINNKGKYAIFLRNETLTKAELEEKFSVFGDDDLFVYQQRDQPNFFINFNSRENCIKARKAFPELKAVFAHVNKERKYDGKFEKKGGYNSKDDSDNKSCSSIASTSNRTSYQNSKISTDESTVNDTTSGGGQNKTKQKNNYGNYNKIQENSELTRASGSSTQKSHSSNGSLDESAVNDRTPGNGQNKLKQNNNFGNKNKKPETKESTPSASCSLDDGNVEDLDEIPLLVSSYEAEIMENLKTVETIVVVLCNLPPWLRTGDVFRLIYEATELWPLEIEIFHSEKRTVQHSAYVHFRNFKEAENCARIMNYMWVQHRQLICVLLDEITHLRN